MTSSFSIETPAAPGAVAVIRLRSDDAAEVARLFDGKPVEAGALAVRRVLALDDALVARSDESTWLIMPHGGRALVQALAGKLESRGFLGSPDRLPESTVETEVESHLPQALSKAASPLAIDLLLDQPRRWRLRDESDGVADAEQLSRLIDPPVVVAVGAPNIGKSSLLNALAGRSLAVAFDRAGTTRDAVGAFINVRGLVVRWFDTPGLDVGDKENQRIVRDAMESADLVLSCFDAQDPSSAAEIRSDSAPMLRVGLRADRSNVANAAGADVLTSATTGDGLSRLAALVRERLVPEATLQDPRAWRFWTNEVLR
ncbi:MAG: GTPase [Phycisphaerales bacterium]